MYQPGATIYDEVTTHDPSSGAAADADALPSAVLVRNGTDSTETVTVEKKATGVYRVSTVVPDSWSVGDAVHIRVAATVGGVAANWKSASAVLVEGAGVGPYKVTATVEDEDEAPIEGARIRLYKAGSADRSGTTSASGLKELSVTAGTWNVVITADTATFTPTTITVTADVAITYTMTTLALTPSDTGKITGYTVAEEKGERKAGVTFSLAQLEQPAGESGRWYDTDERTEVSDSTGLVQFTNLRPGARYRLRSSDKKNPLEFTVPSTQTTAYAIPSWRGSI